MPTSPRPATWAVVVAAGSGSRLARAGLGLPKQFLTFRDRPLFWHAAMGLAACPALAGLVLVFAPDRLREAEAITRDLIRADASNLPILTVPGGARRQDSVRAGLSALPRECRFVLVHDAARPFAAPDMTARVVQALILGKQAVIPAVAVTDTIIRVSGDGLALSTLPRQELAAVQTPQGFDLKTLLTAHATAEADGFSATDDASMVARLGIEVHVVEGSPDNVKITHPADLALLARTETPPAPLFPVVGHGYDVHRYAGPGEVEAPNARPMKLGGVPIPGAPRVLAHSDGDVLLHAITDALLGCLGLGDIGALFPDTDPGFSGMESGIFLSEVLARLAKAGMTLLHVDATLIAQVPRIAPHREHIRCNLASLLGLDPSRVGLKATTEEGLGFTGEKRGIKAVALATVLRPA
ncbi:2-C-methyl-D-erythritol 4-phosphate cytidylyltransferase [Desulfolutivibrio sulfoxidireducens]|uniref:2-C-methyl-D-erythritol 4-phosphate cytidylyltransferase n=1 Tax=Desulfolutivibrio sulfoxidireducens TaxID=2773299 RepID=UPI00159E8F90|nr:2-C-methyl-D-erythritol 4-phosphate cytidylyltransferase [Desulfolutivibrio sulfoxidireducens]QLA15987.1 2-C-methyl-D-erythritol 4-phosphate cytidylyltransferase [Desulfolutivibrio sulfoxidireducens]QLA20106.1 2-C-methyl-D-erythritol 4-phosphate cytidylyltransferase [Desulfolutivibrio sulfoxidireducens]